MRRSFNLVVVVVAEATLVLVMWSVLPSILHPAPYPASANSSLGPEARQLSTKSCANHPRCLLFLASCSSRSSCNSCTSLVRGHPGHPLILLHTHGLHISCTAGCRNATSAATGSSLCLRHTQSHKHVSGVVSAWAPASIGDSTMDTGNRDEERKGEKKKTRRMEIHVVVGYQLLYTGLLRVFVITSVVQVEL